LSIIVLYMHVPCLFEIATKTQLVSRDCVNDKAIGGKF
jgi:hypothetical protein